METRPKCWVNESPRCEARMDAEARAHDRCRAMESNAMESAATKAAAMESATMESAATKATAAMESTSTKSPSTVESTTTAALGLRGSRRQDYRQQNS